MIEIKQTAIYQKWYRKLKDRKARAIVAARIERLIYGHHPGDISIVGDGISELRIHYGPDIAFTLLVDNRRSYYCCAEVTKPHNSTISNKLKRLSKN